MTSAQPRDDLEARLSRLEALMTSAGNLLIQASNLAQRNAADIDAITQTVNRTAQIVDRTARIAERNTASIQALTQRVDSLTAASERHDRILDYLLRREAGDIDLE